ncbi:hypothetical protein GO755_17410 [Spirosoma sp. HMF4905]|uniref:Cardiolipin synthase N-terminal domain-containing protein n=1 Tax=Spirosoma arboris TaxID=2682092 RepID=A0A7K1SDG3_9BACT|nr:PLD nuclease N-terminal domain-containing protein [Spirosoma arboris]MVM31830.1 hypothetical protein [Spirosoma arboris]
MYSFIGIGPLEIAIFLLALILGFLLPIIALVDIIRSEFKGTNDKLIWVIIVLFLNFLGALLYFFIGRNQRIK